MENLLDDFQKAMSPQMIDFLSRSIGGESKEATATAASGIFSVLLNAMNKNAQQKGADGLLNALQKDHDGSILDNAVELLSGMRAPSNPNTLNSYGILGHLLGNQQGDVVSKISKLSGLDAMDVGQLLLKIAPIAMGVIGKTQQKQNLSSGSLFDLLNQNTQQIEQKDPTASIFRRIIDSDGDGNIMDDLTNIGLRSLGSIFSKR